MYLRGQMPKCLASALGIVWVGQKPRPVGSSISYNEIYAIAGLREKEEKVESGTQSLGNYKKGLKICRSAFDRMALLKRFKSRALMSSLP